MRLVEAVASGGSLAGVPLPPSHPLTSTDESGGSSDGKNTWLAFVVLELFLQGPCLPQEDSACEHTLKTSARAGARKKHPRSGELHPRKDECCLPLSCP